MIKLNKSKIGCAILAATFSLPSYAISIEQAWQQAKQNDPNYEKAKIGVQLGEVGVDSSRSSLLPGLSATHRRIGMNPQTTPTVMAHRFLKLFGTAAYGQTWIKPMPTTSKLS